MAQAIAQPIRRLTASERHWRTYGSGYLFLLPAALLYAVFVLYPFVQSIFLSLTDWNGVSAVKNFVGFENYAKMFSDPLVGLSLGHNLIWIVIGTVIPIVIGLLLAVLVSGTKRGYNVFRTAFFLPQVLSPVIIGITWGWIYHPLFGVLNTLLERVGLVGWQRGWLGETSLALYAVLIAAMWAAVGFVFVILLAGLQNVSVELLEAADIDGANAWQKVWNVIVPQLSNVLTVVATLLLIGGFSVFDIVFIMTQGGPANSTQLLATYAYQQAFIQNKIGYGAALVTVMTLLALTASVVFIEFEKGRSADMVVRTPRYLTPARTRSSLPGKILRYAVLIAFLVYFLAPVLLVWSAALRNADEININPLGLPLSPNWNNLIQAWTTGKFSQYVLNSVLYCASIVSGVVMISALAGFALAHMALPGRQYILTVFLLGVMIPFQSIMIPLYYLLRDLHLLQTYLAFIVPAIALGLPFGIFLMRGFFSI
ncbi:MAG: ABC transporter permease subunit, partial [Pleurocapsa sp. SU_196_0]|nr:ABC transporter permease subunit [Pleurocapsa sp. SU_196_0]